MDETQAVLDFFTKAENLALGLAVAELVDQQRTTLNQHFWQGLQQHLAAMEQDQGWQILPTEDRNTADTWLGLHAKPHQPPAQFLSPMLEQQLLGEQLRIYYGVMWHTEPTPAQQALPAVLELSRQLQAQGMRPNARFLGWQWSLWFPRRRDFLLRYQQQPESLLQEIAQRWYSLCSPALLDANAALDSLPPGNVLTLTRHTG